MQIPVKTLCGIGPIPAHRTRASKWLHRAGINLFRIVGSGGEYEATNLSDLPDSVRLAHVTRDIEAAGLVGGIYDEDAHGDFAATPSKMRAEAECKAEIARLLISAGKFLSCTRLERRQRINLRWYFARFSQCLRQC